MNGIEEAPSSWLIKINIIILTMNPFVKKVHEFF